MLLGNQSLKSKQFLGKDCSSLHDAFSLFLSQGCSGHRGGGGGDGDGGDRGPSAGSQGGARQGQVLGRRLRAPKLEPSPRPAWAPCLCRGPAPSPRAAAPALPSCSSRRLERAGKCILPMPPRPSTDKTQIKPASVDVLLLKILTFQQQMDSP